MNHQSSFSFHYQIRGSRVFLRESTRLLTLMSLLAFNVLPFSLSKEMAIDSLIAGISGFFSEKFIQEVYKDYYD